MRAVELQISGMGCAACALEIERALAPLPGLAAIRVDAATARARVQFADSGASDAEAGLDVVLRAIRRLGYSASIAGSEDAASAEAHSRRSALKRLAVSGFGMMQAMMFAFALYSSDG